MASCASLARTFAATVKASKMSVCVIQLPCRGCGFDRPFIRRADLQPARQFRTAPLQMGRRAAKNALRKGKSDGLKAKLWGKYGKLVLQAAKSGGPDPQSNLPLLAKSGGPDPQSNKGLSVVLDQARKAGVPRDIIDRNIKRSEDKNSADIHEAVYEVYGPGGTGFVLECLTDNNNRASTEIWTVVKKLNGKMAESGSVLFNFQRRGQLLVKGLSEEEAYDAATECGGEDVEPVTSEEDASIIGYRVITAVEDFGAVRDSLSARGLDVCAEDSGLAQHPLALVDIEDDDAHAANEELYERLLELDDVDSIFCNGVGIGHNPEE